MTPFLETQVSIKRRYVWSRPHNICMDRTQQKTLLAHYRMSNSFLSYVNRLHDFSPIMGLQYNRGELDSSLSIDDYIDIQLNRPALTGHSVDAMNALQQGCYSQYLSRYLDLFPSGQILIINFEYLTQSPLKMMEIICSFARLNPDFYQDYKFSVYNPTHSPRFPKMNRFYRQFARSVSNQLYQLPLFWNPLRQCFRQSQSFMQYFGKQPAKKPKLSEPLREAVTRFYEPESTKLANIFQHSSHHWSGSNAFSYWIN
ncbi:MAG: hypothetical protein R2867_17220 [Caldilineaceae bacterium]